MGEACTAEISQRKGKINIDKLRRQPVKVFEGAGAIGKNRADRSCLHLLEAEGADAVGLSARHGLHRKHQGRRSRRTVVVYVESSEERRVGEECDSTGRYRGSPYH